MVYAGNRWLNREEMKVNGQYIMDYLTNKGWTKNAVAGMLGNMETESTINPAIWQNLDEGNMSAGFGLVQWTPASNYIDWANSQGLDYKSMDTNLKRILYELDNGLQYYPTDNYPLSFHEFTQSTETPEYLASAFLKNYERAGEEVEQERRNQAIYWFNELDGEGGGIGYQLALLPIDVIWITQCEDGDYSHQGEWAIDFVGYTDKYPYYAPFDAELIGRYDDWAGMIWRSVDPVMCADGQIRNIVFRAIHDCNPLFNVGDTVRKGELIGHTGICGNVTGDHLHLDVWEGTEWNGKDVNERLHIYDVFAVNEVKEIVDDPCGYDWKESDWQDGDGGGTPPKKTDNLIMLLLCDALNGWKF